MPSISPICARGSPMSPRPPRSSPSWSSEPAEALKAGKSGKRPDEAIACRRKPIRWIRDGRIVLLRSAEPLPETRRLYFRRDLDHRKFDALVKGGGGGKPSPRFQVH